MILFTCGRTVYLQLNVNPVFLWTVSRQGCRSQLNFVRSGSAGQEVGWQVGETHKGPRKIVRLIGGLGA